MRVRGRLRVPGDKSISHRALMFAALGEGSSRLRGLLDSADVRSTAGVLRALGIDVPTPGPDVRVHGTGIPLRHSPATPLDCGNSGTTTRLMAGIVAGSPVAATFVGDASLSRRPMRRIARPLTAMGARIDLGAHDGLPMTIHGGRLTPIDWESPTASAQVKSAVLLAGVASGVGSAVREPTRSRDHTERMLRARGVDVEVNGTHVRVPPGARLAALDTVVPGDPSSAAFFAALAALADDGEILLDHVCVNPTRTGFFDALREMGADVDFLDQREDGGEPVATVRVAPAGLRGVTIGGERVPSLVDEIPMLACLAARADGETTVTGASELRVKESDRIAAVVDNLRAIGADAEELPDGLVVRGSRVPLHGRVRTHGDHRIAMAFGILGALPGNEITLDDRECVGVSYPGFWADLQRLGGGA